MIRGKSFSNRQRSTRQAEIQTFEEYNLQQFDRQALQRREVGGVSGLGRWSARISTTAFVVFGGSGTSSRSGPLCLLSRGRGRCLVGRGRGSSLGGRGGRRGVFGNGLLRPSLAAYSDRGQIARAWHDSKQSQSVQARQVSQTLNWRIQRVGDTLTCEF